MNVTGSGFGSFPPTDGWAAPHGRRLLCRFGGTVVNATLHSDTTLRCVTPPAVRAGAGGALLRISLNGVDFPVGSGGGGEDEGAASWGGARSDTSAPGGVGGATCAALPGVGRHCPAGEAFDVGGPGRPPSQGGGGRDVSFFFYHEPRLVSLSPAGGRLGVGVGLGLGLSG